MIIGGYTSHHPKGVFIKMRWRWYRTHVRSTLRLDSRAYDISTHAGSQQSTQSSQKLVVQVSSLRHKVESFTYARLLVEKVSSISKSFPRQRLSCCSARGLPALSRATLSVRADCPSLSLSQLLCRQSFRCRFPWFSVSFRVVNNVHITMQLACCLLCHCHFCCNCLQSPVLSQFAPSLHT